MTHNEVFLSNVTNTLFPLESRDLNLYWTKQKIPGDVLEMQEPNPVVEKGFWKAVVLTQGGQGPVIL